MTLSGLTTSGLYVRYTGIDPAASAGTWAYVSAMTGSPTRTSYTDGNAISWYAFKWTGAGSLTTSSAGILDLLVVGGGAAASINNLPPGVGGDVVRTQLSVSAGTFSMTVGAGKASDTDGNWYNNHGGDSTFSIITARGAYGTGTSGANGVSYDITGTSVTYGSNGYARWPLQTAPANTGQGGDGYATNPNYSRAGGANGVVVVRVPQAFVTASSGWV